MTAEETAEYWSKRPRGSQLGAWASQQSQPIGSRAELLGRLAEVTERFADQEQCPGSAALGRLPRRAGGRGVLAGPENRMHNRIRVLRKNLIEAAGAVHPRLQPPPCRPSCGTGRRYHDHAVTDVGTRSASHRVWVSARSSAPGRR